jgi:hypothetical protein
VIPENVALWSACESNQTSADAYIDKQWQGAFTAAFIASFMKGKNRADIVADARKYLRKNNYQQVPHLYCWQKMALAPVLE